MHQSRPKKVKDRIGILVKQLAASNFYQQEFVPCLNKCLKGLCPREIDQIVCYGLGSFHDGVDVTSRYQLALLLLIYSHLLENDGPINSVIEIYDPLFDQNDIDTLMSYKDPKFKLIEENEYCARRIAATPQRCTLVYMPHLDKYLYNNLLGINWSADNLGSLVVLGNSFREMVDSEPASRVNLELYYVNCMVTNFQIDGTPRNKKSRSRDPSCSNIDTNLDTRALIDLPLYCDSFEHSDIFNSLALHYINDFWLKENADKILKSWIVDWIPMTSCKQESILDSL